jgi:hypothetical protein
MAPMTAWMLDPTDPTVAILPSGTDQVWGAAVGPVTLRNVHTAGWCAGRPCVIHRPTRHHMRDWPLHWRADRRLCERTCPHGVGHPDPDEIGDGAHGCDGCCAP